MSLSSRNNKGKLHRKGGGGVPGQVQQKQVVLPKVVVWVVVWVGQQERRLEDRKGIVGQGLGLKEARTIHSVITGLFSIRLDSEFETKSRATRKYTFIFSTVFKSGCTHGG